MNNIYPSYMNRFRCIAGECRHSCCKGWEIDIDRESLERFRSTPGRLGEKLRLNIFEDENGAGFVLSDDEKCPFLRDDGLCELIAEKGEGFLCDICKDHPRFRNFYNGTTETGLGLCCEEAARLIIENEEKVDFVAECEGESAELFEEEKKLVEFRNSLIDISQNRNIGIEERIGKILGCMETAFPSKTPQEWARIFSSLECLDNEKEKYILLLEKADSLIVPPGFDTAFEQLLVYFLFRHAADAVYDGRVKERVLFCLLSVLIIGTVFSKSEKSFEKLEDISRVYSSEIEYSDENIEILLDILSE